ncbi:hypothetical protein [Parolsenella catena]|uniref:hypothetical protein n=1 Tax=Parolsenella catena TaxID=2003188 RepID=UPI00189C1437|nr:hypothetical protein [Parolsenella catena]
MAFMHAQRLSSVQKRRSGRANVQNRRTIRAGVLNRRTIRADVQKRRANRSSVQKRRANRAVHLGKSHNQQPLPTFLNSRVNSG